MATVTITEILGGDNIAASRVVLNNNFTLLQNAINTLETRLNTSYVPGGSLNVGDVQVLKYNRAVSTNIFLCQASGQIDGNLSIGTALSPSAVAILGSISASTTLGVDGAVNFNNTATTSVFNNQLDTRVNGSDTNTQLGTVNTKSPLILTQGLAAGSLLAAMPVSGRQVVHLSVAAYTGVAPNNIDTFTMPPIAGYTTGQIFTFVLDNLAAANTTFIIDNTTNWDPAFDATAVPAGIRLNDTFNAATDPRFAGIWITVIKGVAGWKVIGAHPDVLYI